MKNLKSEDTICALSTPVGEAGIGIVRISGQKALRIADKIFMSKNKKKPSAMPGFTMQHGFVVKKNSELKTQNCEIIDEVLLSVMKAPKTYTKEDIVEINAHGGMVCLRRILDLVLNNGARIAQPGEFTKRAFLNGRIDLSQAESVMDIISAKTEASLKAAGRQLNGELSQEIKQMISGLLDIHANIEASIDFCDEQIDTLEGNAIDKKIAAAILKLKHILADYHNGMILRNGITTVICGKPNVGKSTLMNRFLKQKRVIVTPIAGTTRDAIEEIINVNGIPIKIVDTAGIMRAEDEISKHSIQKSRKYMKDADLILLVLDSSDKLNREDIEIIDFVKNKKVLFVINKTDLKQKLQISEIKKHLQNKKTIWLSAQKDETLDKLYNAISEITWSGELNMSHQPLLTNTRHARIITNAISALEETSKNNQKELLAVGVKESIDQLKLITGEDIKIDLLDEIFSKFCIGK